jgi:hypothetical protein
VNPGGKSSDLDALCIWLRGIFAHGKTSIGCFKRECEEFEPQKAGLVPRTGQTISELWRQVKLNTILIFNELRNFLDYLTSFLMRILGLDGIGVGFRFGSASVIGGLCFG